MQAEVAYNPILAKLGKGRQVYVREGGNIANAWLPYTNLIWGNFTYTYLAHFTHITDFTYFYQEYITRSVQRALYYSSANISFQM